jgi:hypothetical protein
LHQKYNTPSDEEQFELFFQEERDQQMFDQFFEPERRAPTDIRGTHGGTTYRSLDEHPLFKTVNRDHPGESRISDRNRHESFQAKRRRLQVSIPHNSLQTSVNKCSVVSLHVGEHNEPLNGSNDGPPCSVVNETSQSEVTNVKGNSSVHSLSPDLPPQGTPYSRPPIDAVRNVATETHLHCVNVNPTLAQMSQLAINIRTHMSTNKRRRTHYHGDNDSDCVIPATSLDDAFTRRAWKQGTDFTNPDLHATGEEAYWAATLGPRSDDPVLPSYNGRHNELPIQCNNVHSSSSRLDGPPTGRPPDLIG